MPEVPSPDWLSWAFWAQDHESIRDLVITIAALVGIPFVIWREWLHHRQTKAVSQQAATAQLRHEAQVEADRERRITDNFTRAVELLGSDRLEMRLGGIYALERIARESQIDHWPITETLTAYVRERARWTPPSPQAKAIAKQLDTLTKPQPATDVQAILTVLGRRKREHEGEKQRLDLIGTALRGYNLNNAHLERANLDGAHLERASLFGAHLENAILVYAHLEGANLDGAHLEHALFNGTHLEGAQLVATDLTQEQFDSAISDENTKVPPHIKRPG